MFSISNLFNSTPAQAPAPTPATPGNLPAAPTVAMHASPGTAPNGTVPEMQTPLDAFQDLWNTQASKATDSAQIMPALNAEDVQKAMAKADFGSFIPKEHLATIAGADQATQQAFMQAMNSVAQQVMVQSTMVSNKLAESAVNKMRESINSSIPGMVRQHAVSDHTKTTNPLFTNPAVKPVVEATQAQLLNKFPNATPAEITQMTQDYILAMGKAFSPQAAPSKSPDDLDWSQFLN